MRMCLHMCVQREAQGFLLLCDATDLGIILVSLLLQEERQSACRLSTFLSRHLQTIQKYSRLFVKNNFNFDNWHGSE